MKKDQLNLWNQFVEFFEKLFSPEGFPARWHCGLWTDFHGWFYIFSDLAIWCSYMVIPYFVLRLLWQKRGIPVPGILWFFSAFIMLCGLTHMMDVIMFWYPVYRLNALVRFLTAVFSWATVIALFNFFPFIMSLKTGKEYNKELDERKKAQEALQQSNAKLEHEIEERKKTEQELIISKRTADQSNQLKDAFLANMSHEIRTPMNAIIGFADILGKRKLGEQEMDFVETIKSSGSDLLVIINDILDLSKIESGLMVFEEQPISIQNLFHSLSALLAQKAKEKNIELTFICDKDIPDTLQGDPTRLTQILMNLVNNAIKFTVKGSVNVFVNIIKNEDELSVLKFSVKDTGIGIQEDKMEHIFDRFRQAESNTTRKYGGTGLGLSITKQLIELQGGTLSVTSKVNSGSEFIFTLPFKNANGRQQLVQKGNRQNLNLAELSKLKILLVEDNLINIKFVSALFLQNGMKTEIAETGKEAIEKVKNNLFDIVLMDIEMHGMNGYEATTIIRKDLKSNIPIIAMTAHAMTGEREKCMQFGMNDYVSKPIDPDLLFEKMHHLTIAPFEG